MKQKVLLINPPYPIEESPSAPYGLMALAGYLLENGCEVIIEDYIITPYSRERIARVIGEFKPDVIGATGVTMNIKKAINILKDCKEIAPETITVMGGPHVTFDADAILTDHSFVDIIVRGEGELTFLEFIGSMRQKDAYSKIKGISYRENGRVVHNERREFIEDINILPLPARHLVKLSKYKALGFPLSMVTSRGCPFECIFCVGSRMIGRRVRYFDIQRVVDEFEMLAKLGYSQINIVDDLFTSNKKRCIEFCNEIMRRGIKHNWTAFARVDTVSKDLLEIMKAAGCTMLCFGIESGNQEILDLVKKKTSIEKCRQAVALCNETGVQAMTSYILGLPGETPETVRQTLEFASGLSPLYGYHILSPFPGTEVRDKAAEYGMRILSSDWDRYDANQSVAESVTMPHQEVDRIVAEFYDKINSFISKIIKKHENGEQLSDYEKGTVRNIEALDFSLKVMHGELVESYAAQCNGNGFRKDEFVKHLAGNLKFPEERVHAEVERLLEMRCLNTGDSGSPCLSWA